MARYVTDCHIKITTKYTVQEKLQERKASCLHNLKIQLMLVPHAIGMMVLAMIGMLLFVRNKALNNDKYRLAFSLHCVYK